MFLKHPVVAKFLNVSAVLLYGLNDAVHFNSFISNVVCKMSPISHASLCYICTVYPKKYAHGFVVLCFVVVMQSFIMNSHEVFIHIHQGCFAGTGAIVRLPQCQWSKPDGYGKISQCITTTKHSKAKTVCIFLGIYCTCLEITKLVTTLQITTEEHNVEGNIARILLEMPINSVPREIYHNKVFDILHTTISDTFFTICFHLFSFIFHLGLLKMLLRIQQQ